MLFRSLTVSSTGLLSGYIQPKQLVGAYGPVGFDGDLTAGETVTAGAITVGGKFVIQSVGTTDFTLIGASSNTVGTIFIATGVGTGTGVVSAVSSLGTGAVIEQQQFDYGPFDFNEISASINYSFTVQAFDGANYDTQTYLLQVQSRTSWTADNTLATVDKIGRAHV